MIKDYIVGFAYPVNEQASKKGYKFYKGVSVDNEVVSKKINWFLNIGANDAIEMTKQNIRCCFVCGIRVKNKATKEIVFEAVVENNNLVIKVDKR